MTPMTDYDVYRSYLALKLHFTTDQYDVIKQQGRVRASKQAFYKRKDLLAIRKLADSYEDKEVVNFLVANFVSGDKWGGVFDIESKKNYLSWKGRIESMSYIFNKEVQLIVDCCNQFHIQFKEAFAVIKTHPLILKMYLKKMVSIETLVILNKINNFTHALDTDLKHDIIWPEVSRIIKKYSPFLSIDKEKYESIIRARTRYCDE